MRILPVAVTQFSSSAWNLFKARPASTLLASLLVKDILDGAVYEGAPPNLEKFHLSILALLVLKEIEPVCVANLASHPLSTVIGLGVTGCTLYAFLDEDLLLNFLEVGFLLLVAAGLRCYGPSLFTHRYLTWVR